MATAEVLHLPGVSTAERYYLTNAAAAVVPHLPGVAAAERSQLMNVAAAGRSYLRGAAPAEAPYLPATVGGLCLPGVVAAEAP